MQIEILRTLYYAILMSITKLQKRRNKEGRKRITKNTFDKEILNIKKLFAYECRINHQMHFTAKVIKASSVTIITKAAKVFNKLNNVTTLTFYCLVLMLWTF